MIGLVAVLLFVSVASMLFDRVKRPESSMGSASTQQNKANQNSRLSPDEPLAELGVAPTVTNQPNAAAARPATGQPQR
jgi:hypothetical protein